MATESTRDQTVIAWLLTPLPLTGLLIVWGFLLVGLLYRSGFINMVKRKRSARRYKVELARALSDGTTTAEWLAVRSQFAAAADHLRNNPGIDTDAWHAAYNAKNTLLQALPQTPAPPQQTLQALRRLTQQITDVREELRGDYGFTAGGRSAASAATEAYNSITTAIVNIGATATGTADRIARLEDLTRHPTLERSSDA